MKLGHALWVAAASFLVWIGEAAGADAATILAVVWAPL